MKVLHKNEHSWGKDKDYSQIKELFTVDNNVDLGNIFKFKGKLYSSCIIARKANVVFVKEIKLKSIDEIDATSNYDDFECPYCGGKLSDSWEYEDSFNHICDSCGGEFECKKEVSIEYNTAPIKRDIKHTLIE